jgi:gliding motility-associated-like protein
VRYFIFFIAAFLPFLAAAQLTGPGMNSVRYTSYPSAPAVKDPVYIYCNSSGTTKGTLSAVRPKGSGVYNYSWFSWNEITKSFSDSIKTDFGVASSTLSNVNEGGYKVKIIKSGLYDTSLVGWVFFDTPPVAEASLQQQLCYRVALKGKAEATVAKFYYYDPSTGEKDSIKNEITFLWSSSPSSFIPAPDFNISPIIENYPIDPPFTRYQLPLTDVTYKLQVSSLGCKSEASFDYKSIHVKAEFSIDPPKGEAPLEVVFTDKSIRGSKYTWEFGDGKYSGKDSISHLVDPDPHIYYKPGEYSAKLTIVSDQACIDFTTLENKIVVEPSELKIPNVFTPDGDGLNDYFAVESKSLRHISMEIFSRSGLKVYTFFGDGEYLRQWKGWDGNVNDSSVPATPGIYFYVIRGYGWDDIDYNSKDYRGFVYLYR